MEVYLLLFFSTKVYHIRQCLLASYIYICCLNTLFRGTLFWIDGSCWKNHTGNDDVFSALVWWNLKFCYYTISCSNVLLLYLNEILQFHMKVRLRILLLDVQICEIKVQFPNMYYGRFGKLVQIMQGSNSINYYEINPLVLFSMFVAKNKNSNPFVLFIICYLLFILIGCFIGYNLNKYINCINLNPEINEQQKVTIKSWRHNGRI